MLSLKSIQILLFGFSILVIQSNIKSLPYEMYLVIPHVTCLAIVIFFIYKCWKYKKTHKYLVFKKSLRIRREIRRFEKKIYRLDKKYQAVENRLSVNDNIGKKVSDVISSNLEIWNQQKEIYTNVILLYDKRINQLHQKSAEISLLKFMIKKIQSDPGIEKNNNILIRLWKYFFIKNAGFPPNKELKRLEKITTDIDKTIQTNLAKKVDDAIKKFDKKNRKTALEELRKSIESLQKEI